MDLLLSHIQLKQTRLIGFLKELVECESPSDSPESIRRCNDLIASHVSDIARVKRVRNHILIEFHRLDGPKKKKEGQILGLGHSDTVWPIGTLKSMPWKVKDGRLWGPGVLDMKAGLVFFIYAVRALIENEIPVSRKVVLQINADEETGSDDSRSLTETEAQKSIAVLVPEPGTGLTGKLKTARKGIGDYTIQIKGQAAHSGVDFEKGASAILELARQLAKIEAFTDLSRGTTVNPGVITGGTRRNVIAAEASAQIDLRVATMTEAKKLDRKFHQLKAIDKRCSVEITGGLNRPPMERTKGIAQLFRLTKSLAAELGIDLEESATGGGSDGNFTGALGIPTLDGIGAVGEGAHAPHESLLIDRIADRTALIAKLIAKI